MKKLVKYFKPNKIRIIIFLIILFFLFFYTPIIECEHDSKVKEKTCEHYGYCNTDYYYSMNGLLTLELSDELDSLCPNFNYTNQKVVVIFFLMIKAQ